MKTPAQWRETYPDLFEHTIKLIQEDAFESGRVAGRIEEMRAVALLVEDDLPLTAKSFRRHADELDTTPNPLKSPSL